MGSGGAHLQFPARGRQRQGDLCEFKATEIYRAGFQDSLRSYRETPAQKKKNQENVYDYTCIHRIGCSSDDLGEDDPIGWFELEEEWDEADVKLQQCRVAKVSSSQFALRSFTCSSLQQTRLIVPSLSPPGNLREHGRGRCNIIL